MTTLPRRRSVAGTISLTLATVAVLYILTVGHPHQSPGFGVASGAILAGIVVWAVLQNRADRRVYAAALATQELHTQAAEQRLQIAADLHDIVSHGLGMITLRAQAARLDPAPDAAVAALVDIEEASRRATAELRRMLGALSSPAGAPLSPSPSLADLPALVASAETSGLRVSMHGQDTAVSEGVALTIYRVVQEALANAARHAGPTAVRIHISRQGPTAQVMITDDGVTAGWQACPGTGGGIVMMRRRIEAMGGTVAAGPSGSGFQVLATIPDPELP